MTRSINRDLSAGTVLSLFLQILVAQRVISDKQALQLVDAFNQHGTSGLLANLDFLFPVDELETQPSELKPSESHPIRVAVVDTVKLALYFVHPAIKFGHPYTVKEVLPNGDIRVDGSFGECTMVLGSYEIMASAQRAQVEDVIQDVREPRVQFTVGYVGENYAFESPKKTLGTWMCKHGNYTIVKRASEICACTDDDRCDGCAEKKESERACIGDVIRCGPRDDPYEIVVSRIEESYVEGFERDERFRPTVTHRPNRRACHGDYQIVKRPESARVGDEVELDVELLSYLAIGPACLFALGNGQYKVVNVTDEHAEVEDEGRTWQLPHGWYMVVKHASNDGPLTLDERGNVIPYTGELIPLLPQASTDLLAATLAKRDGIKHITIDKGTAYTVNIGEPKEDWRMRDYGDGPATILVVPGESE